MPGCLEALHGVANRILKGIEHDALVQELEKLASNIVHPSPTPFIFYSSVNPEPIITMSNGKFTPVAAMGIDAGKVLKTGSLAEVQAQLPAVKTPTDLKEKCIVPGFIDPHLHVVTSALIEKFLLNCDPLNPATQGTFEGTLAFLQQQTQKLKPGAWLLGYGYDPSRLEPRETSDGPKFPDLTTQVFDEYNLKDNPILIINASGHIAYANTLALKGVDTDSKDGVLIEPEKFEPVLEKALPTQLIKLPQILEGLTSVIHRWSRKGFTTVFDAGVGLNSPKSDAFVLNIISKLSPMQIAGAAANLLPGTANATVGEGDMPKDGATPLKIKAIKLWMDGSTQGFTGALEEKYLPEMIPDYFQNAPYGWARWEVKDTCHITPETPYDIAEEMQNWASRGYQLMVHTNGDCSTEVVLDAFEKLQTPDPNLRHRLEHFTVTRADQIERAAKLNLYASHTIGHVKYWGHAFSKYILGEDRAKRIHPIRDDVDNGLLFSLHSDSPVTQADGLSYVRTAATRLMYRGPDQKPEDVLGESQTVTVEQALAGITFNPARQILLEDQVGTLDEGRFANFVVLDRNIASDEIDAKDISSDWILETWFQGRKSSAKD